MTTSVVVVALLCLAALNMQQRASWSDAGKTVSCGSFRASGEVAAAEIAKGTAAERAGVATRRRGPPGLGDT
jgi:hypothetical protein